MGGVRVRGDDHDEAIGPDAGRQPAPSSASGAGVP